MAQPLSDLTRDVRPDPNSRTGKADYKQALCKAKVKLDNQAQQAFVELKLALTTDPVVRAPIYDGQPFIVTTDGSKFGFGAVLEQESEEADRKGIIKKVGYPIAYA